MQIGLSESKAQLAKQLAEHYSNPDSKTWTKPAQQALVEFSDLDKNEVREVLDEVQRLVGKDAYQDVFLPKLFEVGNAIGLFAQTQNAQSGKGAARPEDSIVPTGSLRGVDLRAAEQMTRAKALASGDKDVLGKAVGDLDKQIQQMKAELAASDIPEDMKKRLGASIDALSVTKLEKAVDQFTLAHSNMHARAGRMRLMGQGDRADLAINAFNRDAKRSMEKMAHECRDVQRSNSILRLISSGNLSIEALLMAVMLMFFEDNAEQLREKLAQLAQKKAQVADLKEHQKALEAAEDPEALDAAIVDFAEYDAMSAMQDAIEEAKEGVDGAPGVDDDKEIEEAKEAAKDARSGEASGSEVAKEREASGTGTESVGADSTDESVEAKAEVALPQVTTPAVTPPPAAKKKDPVQLSLFKAGTIDPKGTQLQLAFDDLQSKPAKPAVVTSSTSTTTTTSTTSSTTVTAAVTPAATPAAATTTPVVAPAAAAKPALDPAMLARRDAALAKIREKVEKLEQDMQKLELEVRDFQEKCSSSIQLATQIFQTLAQMGQSARNNMR